MALSVAMVRTLNSTQRTGQCAERSSSYAFSLQFNVLPAWCPQQGARQQPEPAGLGLITSRLSRECPKITGLSKNHLDFGKREEKGARD